MLAQVLTSLDFGSRSNGGNIITKGAGHGNELKRLEDPIHLMTNLKETKDEDECESMFSLTKEQITVESTAVLTTLLCWLLQRWL